MLSGINQGINTINDNFSISRLAQPQEERCHGERGRKFNVRSLVLERPIEADPIGPSTVGAHRRPLLILVEAERARPDPRVTPRPRGILQQQQN